MKYCLALIALPLWSCAQEEEDTALECEIGETWEPGISAFRDRTEEWGLVGIQASRLNVADIDGDGWPDLLVRNGSGPETFEEGESQSRWVLRNNRAGGFEDVSESSGLLGEQPGSVFAAGDVDNDGDLDVFIGTSRTDPGSADTLPSALMLNRGDGTFERSDDAGDLPFSEVVSNPAGASFVDFDLDGALDLWVSQYHADSVGLQDRLVQGDGYGSFLDVTELRGLTTEPWSALRHLNKAKAHSWAWGATACDLNNDGLPELMANSYGRMPNHLWRAELEDGQVNYVNASVDSAYAYDHRDDWTQDLSAQCYCRDHPSAEDCDTAPDPEPEGICESLANAFGENYRWDDNYGREPFRLGGNSGATACGDLDNDGYADLVTSEIVHWDVGEPSDPSEILFNSGDPDVVFERPGNEVTGLTREDENSGWDHGDMSNALLDFDNDGWLDIYIGASDYAGNFGLLYHQENPGDYLRLETGDYFKRYRSHGVVAADFDQDGDQDLVVGHSLMRCSGNECEDIAQIRFFENIVGQEMGWIQLDLEGTGGSNAGAVGARVEVTSGGITQSRQVTGGHGHFGSQEDASLHFGIGEACAAQVTVHWPDAERSVQTFTLETGQRYRLVQGEAP